MLALWCAEDKGKSPRLAGVVATKENCKVAVGIGFVTTKENHQQIICSDVKIAGSVWWWV